MVRQNFEHLQPVAHAAARGNGDAEHVLLAFVVHPLVEFEIRRPLRFADRPSGKAARDFSDVLLRVAAIDAQRVQFHQLAAVVLIQALPGFRSSASDRLCDCQLSR